MKFKAERRVRFKVRFKVCEQDKSWCLFARFEKQFDCHKFCG